MAPVVQTEPSLRDICLLSLRLDQGTGTFRDIGTIVRYQIAITFQSMQSTYHLGPGSTDEAAVPYRSSNSTMLLSSAIVYDNELYRNKAADTRSWTSIDWMMERWR